MLDGFAHQSNYAVKHTATLSAEMLFPPTKQYLFNQNTLKAPGYMVIIVPFVY